MATFNNIFKRRDAMKISQAVTMWEIYQKGNLKPNTLRAYHTILTKFSAHFGERDCHDLSTDEALSFLNNLTEHTKQQTKRTRYAHLSSFFNFIRHTIDQSFINPCDTPMMRKLFRARTITPWNIIEKETIDEIIFRTSNTRNRLILELIARGGMRIGEVLTLIPEDIHGRKLVQRDPKSGKEHDYVYIPQKVAERLSSYIREKGIHPLNRIFPICYETARSFVIKAGNTVGVHLRPHDLRRHAAPYASRSGVPIEIVSKVILRHANLSTTQRYLGKVSDAEAMRWIENLYG